MTEVNGMAEFDATRFHPELLDPTAYVAPGATLVGDVQMAAESSVWFGAVLRGDTATIRLGRQTNVQDLCVLHADPGFPCLLGDRVTVGHGAIVHGATVADDCLIGMRAVVMNGAQIGAGSIIAVGAVVTEGTIVPPGSVVMGAPGKVRSAAEARHREAIQHASAHYVANARRFRGE
ncbi:gamma carbonic anhydrase family protein [Lignipirellula cremea]|uniref:2,3,4,5-tetrahydropyridine-2,6-dicarboxylate N-acetyltransferase n=1 Tax=Lignipirellula cremea TaxID=2528010 RepID=A0A518E0W8_9BACT|nr:gamma carbonic anhydrase family protein [Lignipirellula cremea]QDU97735.1 2,3,4,5-tetrahydropyridine-2,6-dicarboxylate N-acetyltransferase [Lignipirellula cremea]